MVELCKHEDWYMACTKDEQGRINRLWFAKTSAQKILKLNYEVLLMDCTYKTNVYRMPLCILNGVTGLNTTFYVGFCFLTKEGCEDYVWVLNCYKNLIESIDVPDPTVYITDSESGLIPAIPHVFPQKKHLLCLWHINKNVLINCRPWFEGEDEKWKEFLAAWKTVLYAKTEEAFDEVWNAMQLKYDDDLVPMLYLQDLVRNHKEKIIKCFTDRVQHFGNTSTSRSEGSHPKSKMEFKSSTSESFVLFNDQYSMITVYNSIGDLKTVVDKLNLLIINERQDFIIKWEEDKTRISKDCRTDIYREISVWITTYALRQIHKQVQRLNQKLHK